MIALQGPHWDYAHAFGVVYIHQHGVLGACLDGYHDEAVSIVACPGGGTARCHVQLTVSLRRYRVWCGLIITVVVAAHSNTCVGLAIPQQSQVIRDFRNTIFWTET